MPLEEKLCFVQFMHPGGEHSAGSDGFKGWNIVQRLHRRKFVEIEGSYLQNSSNHEGLLRFWTEWEAQSTVICTIPANERVPDGPKRVCRPYYTIPPSYVGLQNTDPFVFGGFFYTLCKQCIKRNGELRPTQLNRLTSGSVILFGSCIGAEFALDTVFVVSEKHQDHDGSDYKKLQHRVPKGYWDVTLAAWYNDGGIGCGSTKHVPMHDFRYRLYWGATVDKPVEGMFSFFPCQPAEKSPHGFARSIIKVSEIITDNNKQANRLNPQQNLAAVKKYWKDVRRQVKSQGLWIGTSSKMPKRRA